MTTNMDPAQSINDTKDWLRQLLVWDNNEKAAILRAGMAQNMGLDPSQYARPFPGTPQSVTLMSNQTPQQQAPQQQAMVSKNPNPWLIALGMATGLLAGTAGTIVGIKSLPTPPAQVQPAPKAEPKAQEWQIKWWIDKDGKPQTKIQ